jgi:hypothetical protein
MSLFLGQQKPSRAKEKDTQGNSVYPIKAGLPVDDVWCWFLPNPFEQDVLARLTAGQRTNSATRSSSKLSELYL